MVRFTSVVLLSSAMALMSIFITGCSDGDYLDPTQIGRFRPVPAVNVILDSLGVAEEVSPVFAGAEDPKPVDSLVIEEDYVFNAGDTIRVSIYELQAEGQQYINDFVVSETGKVSIPEVGQIQAAGLTESQLEDEIRQILSPAILREPMVTVILQNSQSRIFTILGDGVPQPGRYPIPRYDFRLSDALAVAGSPRQFNVSYIYVSRTITGKETQNETLTPADQQPQDALLPQNAPAPKAPEDEMMEIIAPSAKLQAAKTVVSAVDTGGTVQTGQPASKSLSTEIDRDLENMAENPAGQIGSQPTREQDMPQGPVEWIYENGRWKPVPQGEGARTEQPTQIPTQQGPQSREPVRAEVPQQQEQQPVRQQVPAGFGWEQMGSGGVQKRVLKIPVKEFLGGDPRFNIIIRPSDVIYVPVDIVGEFYVMGNANQQGVVNLTGRPMTLMQAVAAAGGLGPLAWPERVELRRRISEKREEIALVNLKKIGDGSQPDFFVKPNDTINFGTHPSARWLAVLRNAFRATYGFGFVYDKNFSTKDFGSDPLVDAF